MMWVQRSSLVTIAHMVNLNLHPCAAGRYCTNGATETARKYGFEISLDNLTWAFSEFLRGVVFVNEPRVRRE